MPIYIFENPSTGEVIEIVQTIREEHIYVDKAGVQWSRVFTVPNTSFDSQIDPFNNQAYVDKTGKQKGVSMGDMYEQSKTASSKRKQKLGFDPVEKKHFKDWSDKRCGKRHPKDRE